jgi:integrase
MAWANVLPVTGTRPFGGLLNTLRGISANGFTVHGFRASFSSWAVGPAGYSADLADMCIAHETKGQVRKAYQRDDLLPKRREIMQAWSDYVSA